MMTAMLPAPATLNASAIADLAVEALHDEADLTPKPGLVDGRGPGAHDDMTLAILHDSAEVLRTAFAECAAAAVVYDVGAELRALIGVIGRVAERQMLTATGGVNTHRGALWALGLLSAGAARGGGTGDITAFAARLASIPDTGLADRARWTSHGENARRRFGVAGAAGQAQQGFPHVTRYALPTLREARLAGACEDTVRLDALLSLIAHLDDTCVLHRGGRSGLRAVQTGATEVLNANGSGTTRGRMSLVALDRLCADRGLSPGGSGDLLAATLFLDALDEGGSQPCRL
jgi:triphosphoribosyl-dephospho-CoA synthase